MGYLNVLINRILKSLIRRSQESEKNRSWKVGTQVKITSTLRDILLDILRADGDSIKSIFFDKVYFISIRKGFYCLSNCIFYQSFGV